MCLNAGKQFADVLFVVTKHGECSPEFVVQAFHNLSEVLGYLLETSEDERITVLLGGLVERYVVFEGLVYGDRVPYHQGEYGVSGLSYKHQGGYPPLCGPDHLRRNVKMMSDARYVERLVLRHNEGPPGKRIARPREPFYDHLLGWRYRAREILTRAQQSIQSEVDGRVAARVDLEPLFEPQGGDVFVQVWSQSLLDSPHRASPSDLSPSILPTLPASTIPVAGSTRRASPQETMLVTEDKPPSRLHTSSRLVDANSYAYIFHIGAYVCQQRVHECCEAQHLEHLFDAGLQTLEDLGNGTCSPPINYSAEGGH